MMCHTETTDYSFLRMIMVAITQNLKNPYGHPLSVAN